MEPFDVAPPPKLGGQAGRRAYLPKPDAGSSCMAHSGSCRVISAFTGILLLLLYLVLAPQEAIDACLELITERPKGFYDIRAYELKTK